MAIKRWKWPVTEQSRALGLSEATGFPRLVCAVLEARGLLVAQDIKAFLSAEAQLMDDPFVLKDMDKAVVRIRQALEEEQRIAVYGDYDCDGITSTVLMASYLQSVGADVLYYVPDRATEGYGMNRGAVELLHNQKTDLIITVDNGISAHEEIAYATELGIDTVVTDHHTPRETLPAAVAVVNPHRRDCPSTFKDLAGVGVAFKLICALENADSDELLEYYSDIVALGTIADVMPLTGENRVIVRHGLERIAQTDNPGIAALLEVAGLAGKPITGEAAAFGVIPRINAVGRLGVADDAIELLLSDDTAYAAQAAEAIDEKNVQRKKIEEDILREIDAQLREKPALLVGRLLILAGQDWHHGVVGIVASRLMEKYGKPTVLISYEGAEARGSGRSLPGFSLVEAITACSEKLTRYGGHTLAAGFSLPTADIGAFTQAMEAYAAAHSPVMPVAECEIDCVLKPEDMLVETIEALSLLEPFGMGNRQPVFLLPGLTVEGLYPTNDKKHLRIRFQFGNHLFYGIYFRMTEQEFPYTVGQRVDVAATVQVTEWNNARQLSVRLEDVRPCGLNQEAMIAAAARYDSHKRREYGDLCPKEQAKPSREDIALVYRHIRKSGSHTGGVESLYYQIMTEDTDFCRVRIALDVLAELGLTEQDGAVLKIREGAGKVDLGQSQILAGLEG